jgi:hypothetical protein
MRTVKTTFDATEHRSAREALEHLHGVSTHRAILFSNKHYTVKKAEAERLEIAGVAFAYIFHHVPTGRIMTVPVNDR